MNYRLKIIKKYKISPQVELNGEWLNILPNSSDWSLSSLCGYDIHTSCTEYHTCERDHALKLVELHKEYVKSEIENQRELCNAQYEYL